MIAQRIKNDNVAVPEGAQAMLGRKALAPKRNIKMWGIGTAASIARMEENGYLVLDLEEQDCEEFKNKAPGLYNKVYQQGKEEGRVQGKNAAEISIKAKPRVNEARRLTEEKGMAKKKDFKTLMNEYQTEHKCTKLEALKACGKLYPDEFKSGKKDMNAIARSNTHPENKTDFETLVAKYRQERKCGVTEAMKAIVKSHPNAHTEYIRSRKENHNKMLKERQEKMNATWAMVAEYKKEHKCGAMEAIKAIQNRTRRTQEAY